MGAMPIPGTVGASPGGTGATDAGAVICWRRARRRISNRVWLVGAAQGSPGTRAKFCCDFCGRAVLAMAEGVGKVPGKRGLSGKMASRFETERRILHGFEGAAHRFHRGQVKRAFLLPSFASIACAWNENGLVPG